MTPAPRPELDAAYSDDKAAPTPWADASAALEEAGVYWVVTVRTSGRPHVTPVAGAWIEDAFYFSTGAGEQKAKNLAANPRVAVVTGCNYFEEGLDVVIEGDVRRVGSDDASLVEQVAKTLNDKYDNFFGFVAKDGCFLNEAGGEADVYVVDRTKAFAYGRGAAYSATRYR
ncbi:MAG: hypothetical protein QOF21_1134 [Actinomycetota bacterium]